MNGEKDRWKKLEVDTYDEPGFQYKSSGMMSVLRKNGVFDGLPSAF